MNSNLEKIQNLLGKRNLSDIPNERILNFNAIKTVWITLNRSCNFRCSHCYAQDTGFQKKLEMPFDQVKELVDFSKNIGAKIIILIGGEPLFYKDLFPVLNYIGQQGLISAIASNGYRLGEDDFFQKIKASALGSIIFSIKAGTRDLYHKLTQTTSFDGIQRAIFNFSKLTSPWNAYTVVLTKEMMDDLENVAHLIKSDKTKSLRINFCDPFIDSCGGIHGDSLLSIQDIISYLCDHYEKLDAILEGRLIIQQSFPKCLWPADFLLKLQRRKQIAFSCHLYNRTGLIFDTQRRLLLCNSIPNFPIARFGEDFSTAQEFKDFFMRQDICNLYKSIFPYTTFKCTTCLEYPTCLGGCPLKWFHYSTNSIINTKEIFTNEQHPETTPKNIHG